MSNRTALRMRVLPRFPARITATNGLKIVQDNLDLVVQPDFGALTQVPSVSNPNATFFWGWDQSLNMYSSISFQKIIENIQDVIIGPTTAAMEATSPAADQFIYFTGPDAAAVTGLTSAGRALLDDASAAAQRATLGLGGASILSVGTSSGTVAAGDDSRITGAAQKSSNLSDLASAGTARTNLGLGGAAVLNVGTAAGTVAAGDDGRIVNAAFRVASFAAAPGATIPAAINQIWLEAEGAHYKRVASEPFHLMKFSNGGWWEIDEPVIKITMAGAKGDGSFNDTPAWTIASSVLRPVYFPKPPTAYMIDFLDFSSRAHIVPLDADPRTVIKKRVNDGNPLLKINNDSAGAAGYVPPCTIKNIIFDANSNANYAVLTYNIARWRFVECGFINALQDGYLQLGGAHVYLDSPDAIDNGRAGLAFDKYAYGFPNANFIIGGGVFDNDLYGVYFDGGRRLSIIDCDIEGNGTALSATSAGVWVGGTIGSESGTTEKPGVSIIGGWIEGNKGAGGAIRFGSGFNSIEDGYTCANASAYDVLVDGGRYAISKTTFDGVRTHVYDAATAGFGNSIVDCSTGGTHQVDPNKTSVFGADDPWVAFTPTLTANTGTITTVAYALGFYQRVGKNMHIVVLAGITTAGTGAGDLLIGGLPAPVKRNTHISGHYNNGLTGGPAQSNQTFFRQRKYDGSTIIMNGMDLVVTGVYEVAN